MQNRGSAGMSPLLEEQETKLDCLINSYELYKQLLKHTLRLLLAGLIVHICVVVLTIPPNTLLLWLFPQLCWGLLLMFPPQKLYDIHSTYYQFHILCLNCKLKITTSYFIALNFVLISLIIRSYQWSQIITLILDGLLTLLLIRAGRHISLLEESIRERLEQMQFQQLYYVQNFNRVSAKEPFQLLEDARESLSLPIIRATDSLDSRIHRLKKYSLHPPRETSKQVKEIYSH